jgi:hypothetical protein
MYYENTTIPVLRRGKIAKAKKSNEKLVNKIFEITGHKYIELPLLMNT